MFSLQLVVFCFNLRNTLSKTELFAQYRYLLSNCCFEYGVMERISTTQRVFIVKTFYQNGKCGTQAMRKLPTIFGRNKATCQPTVRRLETKFETSDLVLTVKSPRWKRSCRTEEQLALM